MYLFILYSMLMKNPPQSPHFLSNGEADFNPKDRKNSTSIIYCSKLSTVNISEIKEVHFFNCMLLLSEIAFNSLSKVIFQISADIARLHELKLKVKHFELSITVIKNHFK